MMLVMHAKARAKLVVGGTALVLSMRRAGAAWVSPNDLEAFRQ